MAFRHARANIIAGQEDEGFQRALDYQHELISNAAASGKREAILAVADCKPCYEAVKERLVAEGYRIEWKEVHGLLAGPCRVRLLVDRRSEMSRYVFTMRNPKGDVVLYDEADGDYIDFWKECVAAIVEFRNRRSLTEDLPKGFQAEIEDLYEGEVVKSWNW